MSNSTGTEQADKPLTGNMFLFKQPELLTPEEHGGLGLTPSEKPHAHTQAVRAIPLTLTEFSSAQRYYPIIFASMDNPLPLAVVGVMEDHNLFLKDGLWEAFSYVPFYLRCYPFALAKGDAGQTAVVIDRAAEQVTSESRFPFFANGAITSETETMMQFCAQYEAEREKTLQFFKRMKELELLLPQRATHTPEGQSEEQAVANYVSINVEKLAELDSETVRDLHRSGQLSAAYLLLYSHENWRNLMARRALRLQAAGEQ